MSRSTMVSLTVLATCVGCATETVSTAGGRYPSMMIEVSGHPRINGMSGMGELTFAPPHDPPFASERSYRVEGLRIQLFSLDPTRLQVLGLPEPMVAPHDARYFAEAAFPDLRVEGTVEGVPSHGQIVGHTLHIDALTGVLYAELPLLLVSDDDPLAPPVELHVSIKGFLNVGCLQPATEPGLWTSSIGGRNPRSPECDVVLSAIEATPTDPDAPPPPYDRDGDVIECDEFGPCGGETPVAPFPE